MPTSSGSATSAASSTARRRRCRSACASGSAPASCRSRCSCSSTRRSTRSAAARRRPSCRSARRATARAASTWSRTPRGGKLTYHGPGQLVGYPIMHVGSVPEFILTMERAIVAALGDAGVEAGTRLGHKHVGVWVGRAQDRVGGRAHLPGRLGARLRRQRRERPRAVQLGGGLRAAGGDDDLAARPRASPRASPASASAWGTASARRSGAASGSSRRRGSASSRRWPPMDVGLVIFPTGDGIRPDELAWRPRTRGYESLFFTEHTHIPISRGHRRGRGGGELPEKYRRTHDPFVALAFAAAATDQPDRRHQRLPGDRARPDRAGQADRLARRAVRRALRVRRRRRLEQARRCATTAPTRRRATATCASAWRR